MDKLNLFQCIEQLKAYAERLSKKNNSLNTNQKLNLTRAIYHALEEALRCQKEIGIQFPIPRNSALSIRYDDYLTQALEKTQELISIQHYESIFSLFKNKKDSLFLKNLEHAIIKSRNRLKKYHLTNRSYSSFDKLIFQTYKPNIIFTMAQGTIPALASSSGECQGFAVIYAYNRLTHPAKPLRFSKKVSKSQAQLHIKRPDNADLFFKRLTKMRYQPSLHQQAEGIMQQAIIHQQKHLSISLKRQSASHAVYFQYTNHNTWHFFDSNYGAFEFDSPYQFNAFYVDLYKKNQPWHSYSVALLQKKPSRETWSGKRRSILAGSPYTDVSLSIAILFMVLILMTITAALTSQLFLLPLTIPSAAMVCAAISCAEIPIPIVIGLLLRYTHKLNFEGMLALPSALHYQFFGRKKATEERFNYKQTSYNLINERLPEIDQMIPGEYSIREPEQKLSQQHSVGGEYVSADDCPLLLSRP